MPVIMAMGAILTLLIQAGIAGFVGWTVIEHRERVSDSLVDVATGVADGVGDAASGAGDVVKAVGGNGPWILAAAAALAITILGRR